MTNNENKCEECYTVSVEEVRTVILEDVEADLHPTCERIVRRRLVKGGQY